VKSSMRPTVVRVLAAIVATTSAHADAGELGRTSRGTVSISIIIPPRVLVAASHASREGARGASLCITGTRLRRYSIRMIHGADKTGARAIDRAQDRQVGGTGPTAGCDVGAAAVPMLGAIALAALARHDDLGPLTLLIVPE